MVRATLPLSLLAAVPALAQPCHPGWTQEFRLQDVGSGHPSGAIFDDDGPGPSPPSLYVAGGVALGGTQAPSGLARWNGASWTGIPMGAGAVALTHLGSFDEDGAGPGRPMLVFLGRLSGEHGVMSWDGAAPTMLGTAATMSPGGSPIQSLSALHVLNEGSGPQLYASVYDSISFPGGSMDSGALFRRIPGGWARILHGGDARSMAAFDPDGDGPAPAAAFAASTRNEWHNAGTSWSSWVYRIDGDRAETVFGATFSRFEALAEFDADGTGPNPAHLYVGGAFAVVPGEPASGRIARYDGSALTHVAHAGGSVMALFPVEADAGGPPSLYASGQFGELGGVPALNIARFRGGAWTSLGPGIPLTAAGGEAIRSVVLHDDDGPGALGPRLFVAGSFSQAGFAPTRGIAIWDGSLWLPPGNVVSNPVHALLVADLGDGPALYAGGSFVRVGGLAVGGIASWNGSAWSPVGSPFNNHVDSLAVHHEQGVPRLVAAGKFTGAGAPLNHVAILRSGQWQPLGGGIGGDVSCLLSAGGTLYAGGPFTDVPGAPGAQRLAAWDGSAWRSLGSFDGDVNALAHFQGSLYAAGRFDHITPPGGSPALYARIARLSGSNWVSPAYGVNFYVNSLTAHNDGSGEALYAGGAFDRASGTPASRVARWDGATWSAVGAGLSGPQLPTEVTALASVNEGHGRSALYAGGNFAASGTQPAAGVARWDGSQWRGLGSGVNAPPRAFAAMDPDAAGPLERRAYVGGHFTVAGAPSWSLASWALCGCYANCDGSVVPPILNVGDFVCFQNKYAAGDPGANCDGSTAAPILNVADFICFQSSYASGCT